MAIDESSVITDAQRTTNNAFDLMPVDKSAIKRHDIDGMSKEDIEKPDSNIDNDMPNQKHIGESFSLDQSSTMLVNAEAHQDKLQHSKDKQ